MRMRGLSEVSAPSAATDRRSVGGLVQLSNGGVDVLDGLLDLLHVEPRLTPASRPHSMLRIRARRGSRYAA